MTLLLSGTNGVSDVDGTAATPAIRGSDTNTGIFFPAADTIAFAEGGVESARFDASGNLGIGNTSPTSLIQAIGGSGGKGLVLAGSVPVLYFEDTDGVDGSIAVSDGNMIFLNGTTERARITSGGDLLVGTTSTSDSVGFKLIAESDNRRTAIFCTTATASTPVAFFRNGNGNVGSISTSGTSTSYATSSDYRLKNTIAPMTGALVKVAALKPVTYKWNVDGSDGEGFIAHELAEVCPDAVTGEKDATKIEQYEISPAVPATYDEDGNELTPAVEAVMGEREVPVYQGIDTSFLVATLTAAIQELHAQHIELKAIVDQQAAEIANLKGQACLP